MTDIEKSEPQESAVVRVRSEDKKPATADCAKLSMIQCFFNAYINYFKFSGRASRYEYFSFILMFICAVVAIIVLSALISPFSFILYGLFALASIIPMLSITNRRLHDTGHNLWNGLFNWYVYSSVFGMVSISITYAMISPKGMLISYLITFVLMMFAQIRYLVFVCKRGGTDSNNYGEAPKSNDEKHEQTAFWMIIIFFVIIVFANIISFMMTPEKSSYVEQNSSYSQSYNY